MNDWNPASGTRYIGVTERGDAGADLVWADRIKDPMWAGAVLITKRMSARFNDLVLACPKPVVVHCTCTGNGGTWAEPAAPGYEVQLGFLADLISRGFPAERAVLRIDPIIPTPEFLGNSEKVLRYVLDRKIPVSRVRFSVLDQYPHVIKRLEAAGRRRFYPDDGGRYRFHAPWAMKRAAVEMLERYPFVYESCAEDWASGMAPDRFVARGCVSAADLDAMGLSGRFPLLGENPQGRAGCHCIGNKRELLDCRKPCASKCVYCFWKDR